MEKPPQDSNAKIIVQVDADLEKLIPGFLERRQQDLQTLKSALENGDYEQIQKLAHTLKGVGGGYGFDAITDISIQLQLAAEQQEEEAIAGQLAELETYLQRVEVVFI
jgi:HPt (histidine-containing phosphotransfer) domain-containing protein